LVTQRDSLLIQILSRPGIYAICCRRSAIFGHIARLGDEVPAHKALHSCVRLSQGRLPDLTWKRRPGCLRGRWLSTCEETTTTHLLINGSWLLSAVTVEERRYDLTTTRLPDLTWRLQGTYIDRLIGHNTTTRPCLHSSDN